MSKKLLYVCAMTAILNAGCIYKSSEFGFQDISDVSKLQNDAGNICSSGHPNFIADFGPKKEYYIYQNIEQRNVFRFKYKDQVVLACDQSTRAGDKFNIYTMRDRKNVKIDTDYTETKGDDKHIVREFFGNMGYKPVEKNKIK